MTKILPFDEFWYDCFVNNRISYMSSVNNTYLNMMYINDYKYSTYKFEETGDDYITIKFLESKNSHKFLTNLRIMEKNYKSSVSFMNEIQEMILKGVVLCPKVDLLIWNKWGKGYQKWKSYHYTMLIGYNNEEKEYMALEDNRCGEYIIISQSEEDLIKAIKSVKKWCNRGSDYLIFECDEIIPDYSFDLNNFIKNIEQVNSSIKRIEEINFFCFKKEIHQIPKNMEFQAISISKIITKMQVNKIFARMLHEKNILDDETYLKVDKTFLELRNSYEIIKNILLKNREKKLTKFVEEEGVCLNERLKKNLNYEYDIWEIIKYKVNTIDNNVKIF